MLRLLFISLLFTLTLSADRCISYAQGVRVAHYEVFGVNYPYWFGVGQLKQESRCRNVISRDGIGSQGLAQITYRVWKRFLKSKGIADLRTTRHQLRAQAYIMQDAKKQAYSSHLWTAYQLYNGGGLVNKEIERARVAYRIREVPHDIAREFCRRKVVHFSNGQSISACDINYDYSEKVYRYGMVYKIFETQGYKFW